LSLEERERIPHKIFELNELITQGKNDPSLSTSGKEKEERGGEIFRLFSMPKSRKKRRKSWSAEIARVKVTYSTQPIPYLSSEAKKEGKGKGGCIFRKANTGEKKTPQKGLTTPAC